MYRNKQMYFVFGNIGKETLMLNDSARPRTDGCRASTVWLQGGRGIAGLVKKSWLGIGEEGSGDLIFLIFTQGYKSSTLLFPTTINWSRGWCKVTSDRAVVCLAQMHAWEGRLLLLGSIHDGEPPFLDCSLFKLVDLFISDFPSFLLYLSLG
jgi:hypothetical protein